MQKIASFSAKICTDIGPMKLSLPRSEQISDSVAFRKNTSPRTNIRLFGPIGGYFVYYPSNIFKIGEYHSDIPHF